MLPSAPPPTPARLAVRNLRSAQLGPISFELGAGECIAIVGASGSGKSVLLRMLAELDPCEGDVLLGGVARHTWPAPAWRTMVVYQAAEPAWWRATMRQHLLDQQLERALALISELKLGPGVLDADLALFSTGERQRLALVRSLMCQPRVLMLDEPSAALDAESTFAMEGVLRRQLAQGMSIILVTHSVEQAGRLAQRCLRMRQGSLEPA